MCAETVQKGESYRSIYRFALYCTCHCHFIFHEFPSILVTDDVISQQKKKTRQSLLHKWNIVIAASYKQNCLMDHSANFIAFSVTYWSMRSRDSSVSTVTRWRAGRQEQALFFFSSAPPPDWFWGPPSLLSNGYGSLLPRGKAPAEWSWWLTSICAKVKNTWIYISTPPYVFMAWCLIKQ